MCRLLGVVALEGLEFHTGTFRQATDGVLVNDAVAANFDVVDTTTNVVVASDLDFLGRIGGGIVFALPFVLEGSSTLDPGATEFAFNDRSTIVLDASHGTVVVLSGVDGAFEDDVVFGEAIAIVQTLAIGDATSSPGREGLASALAAVEPEFANFEGLAGTVALAIFDTSGLDQPGTTIDGFLAFVDTIVLVHFFLEWNAFAGIDAALDDSGQCWLSARGVQFANVEVCAILVCFRSLVLLTVGDASCCLEGDGVVATRHAATTVVLVVVMATDWDARKIFSDASLGNNLTTLANVDETAAFDFGTLRVPTRASTTLLSWQSRGDRSAQNEQDNRDDLHDDDNWKK